MTRQASSPLPPRAPSPLPEDEAAISPPWNPTTKLVVGLTLVAMVAGLLLHFRAYIAPLILAAVLAYFLYPLCVWVDRHTPLSWRASVAVVFLLLVGLVVFVMILAGLALVQQIQSLYRLVVAFFVTDLPQLAQNLSGQVVQVGPFTYDLRQYDLPALSQQIINVVQPVLSQLGSVVSVIATRTLALVGWFVFIMLLAYFFLAESSQVNLTFVAFEIPYYGADFRRLSRELGLVWHTFLRGQLIAFAAMSLLAVVLLTVLDVPYSLGLALLVGLARFVPYIGPLVVYVVLAVVTLLQPTNFWGLTPWKHTLVVIGTVMLADQIFDNVIMPRFFGRALGVHPALILITAFVAADLIGMLGFVLAAPLVASARLLLRYVIRKMFDLPPWDDLPATAPPPPPPPPSRRERLQRWAQRSWDRLRGRPERPAARSRPTKPPKSRPPRR
ncbi:MAG: AI-2E family transporter [Chloroflexi bacterium]|nr:AI-2E family transporter [Chloroflexota bacterium]